MRFKYLREHAIPSCTHISFAFRKHTIIWALSNQETRKMPQLLNWYINEDIMLFNIRYIATSIWAAILYCIYRTHMYVGTGHYALADTRIACKKLNFTITCYRIIVIIHVYLFAYVTKCIIRSLEWRLFWACVSGVNFWEFKPKICIWSSKTFQWIHNLYIFI